MIIWLSDWTHFLPSFSIYYYTLIHKMDEATTLTIIGFWSCIWDTISSSYENLSLVPVTTTDFINLFFKKGVSLNHLWISVFTILVKNNKRLSVWTLMGSDSTLSLNLLWIFFEGSCRNARFILTLNLLWISLILEITS